MPKAKIFTSQPILIKSKDPKKIHKADLEFEEIDRYGQSYEARIFLNNTKASYDTPKTAKNGYAGSFHLFGHGGRCLGGPGHCKVPTRSNPYDIRSSHPLTPGYAFVRVTEQLKKIARTNNQVTVTVVPIPTSYHEMADIENLLKFKKLRLVIYDK